MARAQRKTPGLLLRGSVWHIDKIIYGKRICESTRTGDRIEAEALLARRVTQARHVHLFGDPCEHSFREAAAKFFAENQHKRSLDRDQRALAVLDPFIGSSTAAPSASRHAGAVSPITARAAPQPRNHQPRSCRRQERRILNLASRLWRDETDRPWLPVATLIQMQRHPHQRPPYPLSVVEQRLLFSELKAASGPRWRSSRSTRGCTNRRSSTSDGNGRWQFRELGTSIFVIPRDFVKNALDRYVVLNRIARSVIETCRGKHSEFVFTRAGGPVTHIHNSGWKAARRRAAARYEARPGRPCPAGFRSIRVHDLKHTYGHRLRVAGVAFEDRKLLLGHKAQHVTTHYSAPEIGALIEASERVCQLESLASPTISVVHYTVDRVTAMMPGWAIQVEAPDGGPDPFIA